MPDDIKVKMFLIMESKSIGWSPSQFARIISTWVHIFVPLAYVFL
jgi:hypothetical protein